MPTSNPASRTARIAAAFRLPMCGAGRRVPLSSVRRPYIETTLVRLTFFKKPGRKIRVIARPV